MLLFPNYFLKNLRIWNLWGNLRTWLLSFCPRKASSFFYIYICYDQACPLQFCLRDSNDRNERIKPESLEGNLAVTGEMSKDDNRGKIVCVHHALCFVCMCFSNLSFIDRAFSFTAGTSFLEQLPWFWYCTIVG
jgi:hypothetical protein